MRMFAVLAALHLGPGTIVGLSHQQFVDRRQNVTVTDSLPDGTAICTIDRPIEFKAGELVGLEAIPDKATAELVMLDGKTGAELVAVLTAEQAAVDAAAQAASQKAADDKAAADARELADKRAAAQSALKEAGDAAAAAQTELDAATTDKARAAAQQKLNVAQKAVADVQAAVDALPAE